MQYLSLFQLNDDYSLAPEKTEIKRKMFSNYQFMIAEFYNILMGNVKRLVSITFLIKKSMCFIMRMYNFT